MAPWVMLLNSEFPMLFKGCLDLCNSILGAEESGTCKKDFAFGFKTYFFGFSTCNLGTNMLAYGLRLFCVIRCWTPYRRCWTPYH